MKENTWVSDEHWAREGKQDRSRKTHARLLDAAEELFAERGIAGSTIADIAGAADCSIGAFYHHYRDKRAVQLALFDRYEAEFSEANSAAFEFGRREGTTIGETLLALVQVRLGANRTRPARLRALLELARSDPAMASQRIALRNSRASGMQGLLLARREEVGHPDPDMAATFAIEQVGAMIRSRIVEPNTTFELGRSDEDFIRELVRSICAYLQVELPADL